MLKKFIKRFYAPKPVSLSIDEHVRALVAEHGSTMRGLYILECAYLRVSERNKPVRNDISGAFIWPVILWIGLAVVCAAFAFGVFTIVSFGASVAGYIS